MLPALFRAESAGTLKSDQDNSSHASIKRLQPPLRPTFLRIDEVAELLRLSKHTIYELVARDAIPYRKPAGILLFDLEEITEWTKRPPDR